MQGQGKQRTAFMDRSSLCENLLLRLPSISIWIVNKISAWKLITPTVGKSCRESSGSEKQDFFIFFILGQHSWEFCHVTSSWTNHPQHTPHLSLLLSWSHLIIREGRELKDKRNILTPTAKLPPQQLASAVICCYKNLQAKRNINA